MNDKYTISLFMSTDGKHTIQGTASDAHAEEMLKFVAEQYEKLEKWKGTKQEQNKKTYNDKEKDTKTCPIHSETMYAREGKYGKFYSHKLQDDTWCNGK